MSFLANPKCTRTTTRQLRNPALSRRSKESSDTAGSKEVGESSIIQYLLHGGLSFRGSSYCLRLKASPERRRPVRWEGGEGESPLDSLHCRLSTEPR
jgi:hypothetical protein